MPSFSASRLAPVLTSTRALQLFQLMRQGSVILTSILLAKSGLSTADIGIYEMLLYIGTVWTFFWVNGLLQAMTPVFSKLEEEDRKLFIFNNFLIFCGIALLLFTILLAAEKQLLPALTGQPAVPFFGLFCLFLLFNLPAYPVEYIYLLYKKPLHIVLWGMATFGLQVLSVFIPVRMGYGLEGSVLCLVALAACKWLFTAGVVARYGRWKIRSAIIRQYLGFAWPLILNVLIGNFVLMFDFWLVGWWYRDEAVFAVFRYGARELPLAQALSTALGVALIPRLTENPAAGLADMKAMTRRLFHLLFPATVVLLALSKPFFPVVFNPDFAASAAIFNIYLLLTASRVLLPNSIVLSKNEPQVILGIGLLELAVKIVSGFVFIFYWGLPGVAWSAVLAFWVEKLGLMYYLRKKHGIPVSDWLDWRWYTGYVALMTAAYFLIMQTN